MIPISNMIILDEEEKDRLRVLANRLGIRTSAHSHMHSGKAYLVSHSGDHVATTISIDSWFVDMMEKLVDKSEGKC